MEKDNDGIELRNAEHPGGEIVEKFSIVQWFLGLFAPNPKFSKEALEPAERLCICQHWLTSRTIVVHLSWCPCSPECIEYDKLPWYRRLFARNPYRGYGNGI